jgi:uncharacterized membrane protein
MFFAIGTALCTGLAAVLTAEIASRVSGALIISCWRALTAAILLILFAWWGTHWPGMETRHLPAVIGSSLSAAVLGEFCLNKAYRELGARRAALMFATAAPFSVLVGWLFLGESPTLFSLLGISLVVVGLALAIWFTPLHEGNNNCLDGAARQQAESLPLTSKARVTLWSSGPVAERFEHHRAQPAVAGVGIHARMPDLRHDDLGHRDRQVEQCRIVSGQRQAGRARDKTEQIRGRRHGDHRRKARHNDNHPAREPAGLQRLVRRAGSAPPPREHDMAPGAQAFGRNRRIEDGMAGTGDTDIAIAIESLGTQFAAIAGDHPNLEIDRPVP